MAIVLLILYIFNRRSRVQSAREAALLLRPNRTRENGIEDVSGQEVPFEASGCVLRTKSHRDIPYGVIKQDSFPHFDGRKQYHTDASDFSPPRPGYRDDG